MRKDLGKGILGVVAAVVALLVGAATPAAAAGPPEIEASWVTDVTATSANLRAEINANGLTTTYRFEYISEAAYQANLKAIPPRDGFFGASKVPPTGSALLGSDTTPVQAVKKAGGLSPATAYRYRVVASNSADPSVIGVEHVLGTQETALVFGLPDDRGWEMVSPADKRGGAIAAPGALFGGGEFQAAAAGGSVTYGSATSFGIAAGAPPVSQYVSRRVAGGWSTTNVSAPLESAAYGDEPDGAPYRLFSSDLSRSLLFGGLACRGNLPGCPAPNPVLPGTGAPAGYMAYYQRNGTSGAFASLLSAADLALSSVSAEAFEVSLAAASPDLAHVVLASCAKLTANATEVPAGPGACDPAAQNLYAWSGAGLALVNLLPAETTGTPGAQVAAPIGAVSANGRVYWRDTATGDLYLRDGTQTYLVDGSGGASFETATPDGAVAFFTAGGHLHRYDALAKAASDLTPGGGVAGVLGASADGSYVYFQDGGGLKQWHSGTTTTIAPGAPANPSTYPPSTGTARVSADGTRLAFLSDVELNGYDNIDAETGKPDTELYLYGPLPGGGAAQLVCASCNPTGERPQGSASIPGALVNGSTAAYKPRVLSASGTRLFFDSSDELVADDTNSDPDVYQWEAKGTGDCNRSPGCVDLISGGRTDGGSFVDASADGNDVYFITAETLVSNDPGSIDLYDARVGGGFAIPQAPIACIGDACQALPSPPDDPTPGTLTRNAGNPPLHYFKKREKNRAQRKKPRRKHKNRNRNRNRHAAHNRSAQR